jgi:hypothetical protein
LKIEIAIEVAAATINPPRLAILTNESVDLVGSWLPNISEVGCQI